MRFPCLATVVFLPALLSLWGCTDSNQNGKAVHASRQPEFILPDQRVVAADFTEKDIFDKQSISLSSLRGKVIMLNFWATWCPPCREEIPTLRTLQRSYVGTLEVVGVSVFSYTTTAEQFYKDYQMNYPTIYGSFELMGKYGNVGSIPTTFLIDKQGRIAARVVGARTGDEYEDMIKPLLSE